MSFTLELNLPESVEPLAADIAERTQKPDLLQVRVGRTRLRRRWWTGIADHMDDGTSVLDDQADWSEDCFTLDPRGREALAATIRELSELVAAEWTLRAFWVGDDAANDQDVTVSELVELTRSSQLRRDTIYRVKNERG